MNENLVGLAMFWLVFGQIVAWAVFDSGTAAVVVVVVFVTLMVASFLTGNNKKI